MSKLLDRAVDELSKLPGIGDRTALRLALHILKQPTERVTALTDAVSNFRNNVRRCIYCNNISDNDICPICGDSSRDNTIICVVEHVKDVISIENTGQYKGLYHVLGGVISPMRSVSPSDLKIHTLIDNIKRLNVTEVVLAISTSIEGETTIYYISKKLEPLNIKISCIARGIGFADDIDYADDITLAHAIHNRRLL